MPRLIAAAALVLLAASGVRAGAFEDGLARFREAAAAREERGETAARASFREAAEIWERLAAEGVASTRLFTNIGNARAFAGDLGEAVLAYRRALVLDADNARARDALASIRVRLGIEGREEEASAGLVQALFFWHEALAFEARRWIFAGFWVVGLALVLLARRRRRLRIPAAIALAAAGALLVSLLVTDADDRDARAAVLLARTEGRTGDGTFYSTSHTAPLPAGAELVVLERRGGGGGWVRASLRDGTETWLRAEVVEAVLPR